MINIHTAGPCFYCWYGTDTVRYRTKNSVILCSSGTEGDFTVRINRRSLLIFRVLYSEFVSKVLCYAKRPFVRHNIKPCKISYYLNWNFIMIKLTVIKPIGKISSQNQCLDNSNVDAIPSVLPLLFGGHRWITSTDTIVPPTVCYNNPNNVHIIRTGYTGRL